MSGTLETVRGRGVVGRVGTMQPFFFFFLGSTALCWSPLTGLAEFASKLLSGHWEWVEWETGNAKSHMSFSSAVCLHELKLHTEYYMVLNDLWLENWNNNRILALLGGQIVCCANWQKCWGVGLWVFFMLYKHPVDAYLW